MYSYLQKISMRLYLYLYLPKIVNPNIFELGDCCPPPPLFKSVQNPNKGGGGSCGMTSRTELKLWFKIVMRKRCWRKKNVIFLKEIFFWMKYFSSLQKKIMNIFLAALSSSRSLVIGWSVGRLVGHFSEKVIFRVLNGN